MIPEFWKAEFRYSEIDLFVLGDPSFFMGRFVKALPRKRCAAAFTNLLMKIRIQPVQIIDYKVISKLPDK
jgi:hypothetical protein